MFSQLTTYINGDGAVDALKDEFDLVTTLATRTGLALVQPTLVANFAHWLNDPESERWYRTTVQTVRPESLADFNSVTKAQDYRDLGERTLHQVLDNRCDEVVDFVATRAEISHTAAYGLLAATSWVMTVAMSRFDDTATWAGAGSTFNEEYENLLNEGWDVWLKDAVPASPIEPPSGLAARPETNGTTKPSVDLRPEHAGFAAATDTGQSVLSAAPVPATHSSGGPASEPPERAIESGFAQDKASTQRAPSFASRLVGSPWLWAAGCVGLLVVVALLASSQFRGTQNESAVAGVEAEEPNTAAAAVATTTEPVEEDLTNDNQTATADGTAESGADGDNTSTGEPTADATDVDDWPGGRGPVPDTPPARRIFQIDADGDLVLSGSAPSWELAQQVLQVAENNYPVDGAVIANELTWHPDAASSVRSGEAVIAQAASFTAGRTEIEPESLPSLDLAADILNSTPTVYVVITGHTDADGDESTNVSLSADRVDSVVEYLLSQGVVEGQIVTAAAGEDDPTASNDTADGRQSNRRVELVFKNYLAPPIGDFS